MGDRPHLIAIRIGCVNQRQFIALIVLGVAPFFSFPEANEALYAPRVHGQLAKEDHRQADVGKPQPRPPAHRAEKPTSSDKIEQHRRPHSVSPGKNRDAEPRAGHGPVDEQAAKITFLSALNADLDLGQRAREHQDARHRQQDDGKPRRTQPAHPAREDGGRKASAFGRVAGKLSPAIHFFAGSGP